MCLQLVFNTTQTYALMRWLLKAEGYLNKDTSVESSDGNPQFVCSNCSNVLLLLVSYVLLLFQDLNHEKIAVLRLSLVRNLQRALFH